MSSLLCRRMILFVIIFLGVLFVPKMSMGQQIYLDNETIYSNQDPNTETRRSDHFRLCFGHYNRDSVAMTEQLAQGNLQMFEQMWNRWVNEMGFSDLNESGDPAKRDGNKYKANFHFLMTWNDGGGGGSYMSADANGFAYAMANPAYCRYDPPSGATPHEFGHVWEGTAGGFNGTQNSGMWWECTANWMMLQFLNTYPQGGGYIANSIYYPAHGRDYYDSWAIWEAALDDPRYGVPWINAIWNNADLNQRQTEYIIDRMIRLDTSGSPDKAGAVKDLWGDMAKKMITWDFNRKQWLASANSADDGSDWNFYRRCRTPLVPVPGNSGWYRPARAHIPQEFGWNMIPLSATAGTTVSCYFLPMCDPVRQSDWRACLVAVSDNGDARYSTLWNIGTNSIKLSNDEHKLYLVVIAVPKPMPIADPMWKAYITDAGLQFPYAVYFTNAAPKNAIYPVQSHTNMHQHPNGGGWVSNTAVVDSTAYVGPNAQVLGSAQVKNYARVEDYAVVKDSAQVRDYAVISGHAMVEGNAQVYGNAKVRDWARIFGYAEIYENAKAIEHAECGDGNSTTHTKVYGNAVLKGNTYVYDPSTFSGSLITDGDTANGGTGDHGVHFGWAWGQDVSRFTGLTNNGYIYAQHTFEKDNPVFAMDTYGINHGFLMNGCRAAKDTVSPTRGGLVLPLDGINQYVELHNSINDFKETAICVWVKWTGSNSDQIVWSMGDGSSKYMYLTPKDGTTGKVRFVISDGVDTQYLDGTAPISSNTWSHIAVTFTGSAFDTSSQKWVATGTLYINGTAVDTKTNMIVPDRLNAPLMENANYLGRGNGGNYFQGYIDDFRVYMKGLSAAEIAAVYAAPAPSPVTIASDTTPPTPNPATWLVVPNAISDSAITMSATPGTDASGWVEYYFTCVSGGGHDSGWVSFNKYTDVGLEPGTTYTYTVKMRDKNGNQTSASVPVSATTMVSTTPPQGSFAYGPVGITSNSITMTATKVSSPSGLVEYLFSRTGRSSGWQASPTWTDVALTPNASYTYTVQVRDGRGNVGPASGGVTAIAKDMAAPKLPVQVGHWIMMPYATIDNKISMTAATASDPSGVQYYFHCVSGGGPDSGWISSPTYTTPVLADGTYTYQYKVRDKSAQYNESPYSTAYSATIKPTTGYHSYTLSQLATLPDDYLVSFSGTVMRVNTNNYVVKDLASGASITVKPSTYGEATDTSLALKNVSVKGHLYTLNGSRIVTFATVTSIGNPLTYAISGKVTNSSGVGISGAKVYFSDSPNASANPIVTATTDSSGNYSKGVTNGTWYVCAGANAYNTSADKVVVVNGAAVSGVNFTLVANSRVTGRVTRKSDGTAVSGAKVYFSRSANASANPVFTAVTDASGNYSQPVQDGVWYVCAGGTGYFNTRDQIVYVSGADVPSINFILTENTRNIPRTEDLLFSAITESFPDSGPTGNWPTYIPSGQTLTTIGSPTVDIINGIKWDKNLYAEGDGYNQGSYSSPIAVNGATVVIAVKPIRTGISDAWNSCVDIMYDRLVLGVRNSNGQVIVRRNGSFEGSSTRIPDGQLTVLSLVVQPDGKYKVYANGTQIMSITSTSAMTSFVPGVAGDFAKNITVGRNWPDGWSTFNGDIGDVFVYRAALTDAERQQLEADISNKFGIGQASTYTITSSAGAGGSISPAGTTVLSLGGSQQYSITPSFGYVISDVVVDGVSVGPVSTYTFSNVNTDHAIWAQFAAVPDLTITASAGVGGTISPSGTVAVKYGANQQFDITPLPGYVIADVLVDGASVGAVNTYVFSNVVADHTISVLFAETVQTIAELKSKSDGMLVKYVGNASVIYAPKDAGGSRTTKFFYIGEAQAQGGLKVTETDFDNLTLGNQVSNLVGYVRKPAGKEIYLELIAMPVGSGNAPIPPIGMNNRAVLTDSKAQTNAVRIWGKVKSIGGSTSFVVDDGYNTGVTVIVNGIPIPEGLDTTKSVIITGVATKDDSGRVVVLAQDIKLL